MTQKFFSTLTEQVFNLFLSISNFILETIFIFPLLQQNRLLYKKENKQI